MLRPAAQLAALVAVCAAVHSLGTVFRVAGSLAVGVAAAGWGLRRSSLSPSGALAVSCCRGGARWSIELRRCMDPCCCCHCLCSASCLLGRKLNPPHAAPPLLQALLLGAGTLGASFRGGLTLLTFFFASSKITQVRCLPACFLVADACSRCRS